MKKRDKKQLDENLQTVKDAGLVAEKKNNPHINRKAGLRDKSKNSPEGKRVYKTKPLKIRRKRRMLQATIALSAVLVTSLTIAAYGFLRDDGGVGDNGDYSDAGYETVCSTYLPDNGSKPTDYTALENVAFMNYRYKNQENWYSEMHSVVSAMGVKQYVDTYKQFSDGTLISQDITVSGLSSALDGARQFCTKDGRVMWRDAACSSSEYNSIYTKWTEDIPPLENWSIEEFKAVRGFPHTEFSVYVINENTVLSSSAVTVNADGNYTFSMTLNHEYDPAHGEKSAVYYYRRQMKETGNLASRPTFYSVTVQYTCDSTWRILKANMEESYRATAVVAGVNVPSTCSSVSETVYDYLTEKCNSDAYETYYKRYDNPEYYTHPKDFDVSAGEKPDEPIEPEDPTALGYVMDVFGGVMDEGGVFKLNVALGNGQPMAGVVSLGAEGDLLGDIRIKLGQLGAYVQKENDKTYLYISYGSGVKAKVCVDDIPLDIFGQGNKDGDAPAALAEEGEQSDILGDLMKQLGEGTLEYSGDKSRVSAFFNLKLFGISLPLTFEFDLSGEKTELICASSALTVAGTDIDLGLTFGTKDDVPVFGQNDKADYIEIFPADFVSLMSVIKGEYLALDVNYSGYGAEVTGTLNVCTSDFKLDGQFTFKLNGEGAKNVGIAYADGVVYLSLASEGKEPVKLSANAQQAVAIITEFLGLDISSMLPDFGTYKIDIASVLNTVLGDGQFANNFSLEEGCRIGVNGTALLKAFGVDFGLGDVYVTVLNGGSLCLEGLGAKVTLAAGKNFEIDADGYSDLIEIINGVLSLKDGVTLSGNLSVNAGGKEISLAIERLDLTWTDGINLYAKVSFNIGEVEHTVCALYNGKEIKLTFDEIGVSLEKATFADLGEGVLKLYEAIRLTDEKLAAQLPELGNSEKVKQILADLLGGLTDGTTPNIAEIINSLQIGKPEGGLLEVTYGGVTAQLKSDESAVVVVDVSYKTDGINVSANDIAINKFESLGEMPVNAKYITSEELIPFVNGLTEILNGGGLTLTGSVNVKVNETQLKLDINNLSLEWKNGFAFALDGAVWYKNVAFEFYLSYAEGNVVLIHGGAGLTVNIDNGDLDELKNVITDTYNRVAAALDRMLADDVAGVENFEDILAKLDTGNTVAETLTEILNSLKIPNENGKPNVTDIINSLKIAKNDGYLVNLNLGGIDLDLKQLKGAVAAVCAEANLKLGNTAISLNAQDIAVYLHSAPEQPLTDGELLTATQFADMLDYVGATVEVLVQKELTLQVTGALREHGSVKYDINALLEYSEGDGGYPVKLELGENKSFTLSSTVYAHLKIAMNSKMAGVSSFVIEGYLLDANPETSSGKTKATYLKDGELDVYLSVSKLADGDKLSAPLKIYAPVSEIMTLISAAGAMLDLENVDGGEKLGGAISWIADAMNQLLIDKYLPATKDQFSSLGSSLFKQFVNGGVQGIIDNLLKPAGTDGGSAIIGKGAFLKGIDYKQGALDITFNSSAIYSREIASDIYFKAEKDEVNGRTRLTRLEIGNVYIDSSIKNSLTLGMTVGYSADRNYPAAGYTDARGLDTLLKAAVNSASHTVKVNGDGSHDYELNSHYYISGDIFMGLGSLGYTININGFEVFIDPVTNDVSFNLSVTYPKIDINLFGMKASVFTQAATAELTYKGGMVYMRKTPSGKNAEYRVMAAEDFNRDLMGQLTFLFSFGSTITDGDSGSLPNANDLGDMFDLWLSSYTTSESANSFVWNFTLNENTLKQVAGVAISLSASLNADITYDSNGNKLYRLKSIGLDGKLVGLISLSGSLNYLNAGDEGAEKYKDSVTKDLSEEKVIGGYSFEEALGGSSYKDIVAHTKWELLLANGGTRYLSYTSGSSLAVSNLVYKFAEDETPLAEQLVLADTVSGVIYTRLDYPDLSGRDDVEGFAKVWLDSYERDENGNLVLKAIYDKTYSVTVESKFQTDESYIQNADGTFGKNYENIYKKAYLPKDKVIETDGRYYRICGYTLNGEPCEMEEGFNGDGELCYVAAGIEENRVYVAVWEEVFKITFSGNGQDIVRYYGAEENVAENLPEVPYKSGYTGEWIISGSFAGEIGANVYAEYTINSYTVTLFSEILPDGDAEITVIDGETEVAATKQWNAVEGGYEAEFTFVYGTQIKLAKQLKDGTKLFTFNGYVDASYANVNEFSVKEDGRYSLAWEGKTITVNYNYNGVMPVRNVAADNYQREYVLNEAVDANGEYTFLGWWYRDNGAWVKLDDVSAYAANEVKAITVEALWIKVQVSGSGVYWDKSWKFHYTITANVNYDIKGNAELVEKVDCTYTGYRFYVDNSESESSDNMEFFENTEGYTGTYTTTTDITSSWGINSQKKVWHASVQLKFSVEGVEQSVSAHGFGSISKK